MMWLGKPLETEEAPWTWPTLPKPVANTYIKENYTYGGGTYNGEEFWGGITGVIDEVASLDYWTLRERSGSLFRTNSYAQGILRRLVTNVIHKGLFPEFEPEASTLGMEEDALVDWAYEREKQYRLYGQARDIIDCKGYRVDGELQAQIYTEAFIDGDCLVIGRQVGGFPQIQIVSGNRVQTPPDLALDGSIVDGVKLDENGKHLGYWVYQGTEYLIDGDYEYIPTYGPGSRRHTAWMVYSPVKREDDIRGMPGFGIAIQPLNEILKYRGSAQLKAELGARLTGFIKREKETRGLSAMAKGAARRDTLTADTQGDTPDVSVNRILPGTYLTRLLPGEEPYVYPYTGTDVNFPAFEAAILAGLAWALEIPPECLMLSYGHNFAASQAAVREFNMFLEKERERFSNQHCQNLAEEWFLSALLAGNIDAEGFLEAWLRSDYQTVRAWLSIDWIGSIKPSLKLTDEVQAYQGMVDNGWETNARAARGLSGTSFDRNIRKLIKENRMKAEAMRPLLELQREFGSKEVATVARVLRTIDGSPMDEIKRDLEEAI